MARRNAPTILQFISDTLSEEISPAQRVLFQSIYGLPLDPPATLPATWLERQFLDALYGLPTLREEVGPFTHFTLRDKPTKERQADVTAVCGRRSGKTGRLGVNTALYEAIFGGHERYLGKAERGHVVLMAQSMRAVNEAMVLAKGKLARSPILAGAVLDERATEIIFKNHMVLSIWPCTFTSIRGLAIPVCIADEVSVWDVEGVNPDREVIRAVRPSMATFPNRMLLKLSTPWAKAGVIWDDFERCWGTADTSTLVWKAPTWYMNPTIDVAYFVQEYERDPDAARREYGAEFSEPMDAFLPWEAIKAATDGGRYETTAIKGRLYRASVDVAFKTDSTVLCVAHREGDTVIVDQWKEWRPQPKKPLKLSTLGHDVAVTCRLYGIRTVMGDQYAAEPVREEFRRRGLSFSEVAFTARRLNRQTPDERRDIGASKTDIFGAMKTLLLQGRLRLPDIPEGVRQLRNLEVRRSRTGHEQIGAPQGQHDDFPAALALTCWQIWRASEWREQPVTVRQTGALLLDQEIITEDPSEAFLPPELRTQHVESNQTIGAGMRWLGGG